MQKVAIRIAPSALERELPIKKRIRGKITGISISNESFFISLLFILMPRAARIIKPVTRVKLRMFAPITFPKLKAGVFSKALVMPTKSSGKLVAIAMMMNAAVNSVILKKRAIFSRLLTRKAPLPKSTMHAIINHIKLSHIILF